MFQHKLPWIIGILVVVTEMSTDLFAPGLPSIASYFKSPESTVSLTIGCNLLGLAISGLIYGPLSDRSGRRPVMMVGFALFTLGSVLCIFATTIYQLILFRFLQGLGGGVSIVVGLASIRDKYNGSDCARMVSLIEMIITLSPGLAPIIGSALITRWDWQVMFVVLTFLAVIGMFVVVMFYKETNTSPRGEKLSFVNLYTTYGALFKNFHFLAFALIQSLCLSWMVSEYVVLPFVFINHYKIPISHYGFLVSLAFFAYFIGAIFSQLLVHRVGVSLMLRLGVFLNLLSAIALMVAVKASQSPYVIVAILVVSNFTAAFITGNGLAKALEFVSQDAGSGAALITFFQFFFSAIFVYACSQYLDGTVLSLSILMIMCNIISWAAMVVMERRTV